MTYYDDLINCSFVIKQVSQDEFFWLSNIFNEVVFEDSIKRIINESGFESSDFSKNVRKYCTLDCNIFPMFHMESCDEEYPSDFIFENRYNFSSNIEADLLSVAKIMQDFLITFRPNEKVLFKWIQCKNSINDSCYGGAYKISAEKIDYINLKEWLNS